MKILFLDIETQPNLGYTWGKWQQNVIAFKEEWKLLSFAFQWADSKGKPTCITREGQKSDERLTKRLHALLNEADVVVAHNAIKFDLKKIRAKFLEHGLTPTTPVKVFDTLKTARETFALTSNRLDDICALLKLGRKLPNPGFDMWLGCMDGDPKSWRFMEKYNKHDIVLLKALYGKLVGWHKGSLVEHLVNDLDCTKCGSTETVKRGFYRLSTGSYQAYQCKDCGGYSRAKKPTLKPTSSLRGIA